MPETSEVILSEDFTPEKFAIEVSGSEKILDDLLVLIHEKREKIRFNSYETLRVISETNPKRLYPRWQKLEDLLTQKNNYLKFIGINLLANLVSVDTGGLFEKTFEKFFGILKEDVTIAPAYVVRNSWKIVQAKPHLEPQITDMLLRLDEIHPGKQIAMIKGEAIETFDRYFETSGNKNGIIEFVKAQLDNPSPKARKLAKGFLEKWEKR